MNLVFIFFGIASSISTAQESSNPLETYSDCHYVFAALEKFNVPILNRTLMGCCSDTLDPLNVQRVTCSGSNVVSM
jgi:hypothetical protein